MLQRVQAVSNTDRGYSKCQRNFNTTRYLNPVSSFSLPPKAKLLTIVAAVTVQRYHLFPSGHSCAIMPIKGVYFAPYDRADVETKSWPSSTTRALARVNTKSMAPETGYYSILASLGQEAARGGHNLCCRYYKMNCFSFF